MFLGLSDAEIRRITELPSCRRYDCRAQDVIFEQGEEARLLYVLIEGRVQLLLRLTSPSQVAKEYLVVEMVTTGDFFGWSALVAPHVYVLAAVCLEPSSVIAVAGAELNALFDSDHHLGYKVMKAFAHILGARLRGMQQTARGKRPSHISED